MSDTRGDVFRFDQVHLRGMLAVRDKIDQVPVLRAVATSPIRGGKS